MKNKRLMGYLLATLLAGGITTFSRAADEADAKTAKPKREELREKLKNMTPEERRAAIKEWREKNPGAAGSVREEFRKRREELQKLSPEEREAKRKESRAQLEKRAAELQQKKADGNITEREQRQLERIESFLKSGGRPPAADKVQSGRPADGKRPDEKAATKK